MLGVIVLADEDTHTERTSNESVKRSNVSFSASVPVKNPSQTKTYWL